MSAATTPPQSLLYGVKRLESAIRSRLDDMLRDSPVSRPQYTALTALRSRPGISAAELARDSFVSPQAISEVIAGLERAGYVRREPDEADRRRTLIVVTDAGYALLEDLDERTRQIEEHMTSDLEPEVTALVARAVRTMWDRLR